MVLPMILPGPHVSGPGNLYRCFEASDPVDNVTRYLSTTPRRYHKGHTVPVNPKLGRLRGCIVFPELSLLQSVRSEAVSIWAAYPLDLRRQPVSVGGYIEVTWLLLLRSYTGESPSRRDLQLQQATASFKLLKTSRVYIFPVSSEL